MTKFFILILFGFGFTAGQLVSLPIAAGARISLLDIFVVALLMYGAVRSGKKRIIPALWMPIMAFFGIALLSLIGTLTSLPLYATGGGLLYILRWMLYAALYWVAAGKLFPPKIWSTTLIVSGVVTAGLGLVQYRWYPDLRNLAYLGWDPHYERLFGTLLDPNFTGIILVVTLLSLLGWEEKRQFLWLKLSCIIVTLAALVLTYSRSSLIALVAGLVMWGILTGKKLAVGILIGSVILALLLLPDSGEGRNLLRTVSSYARIGNAERAVGLIREKPILGHGFNILRFVSTQRSWIDESSAPSRSGGGLDTSILFVGATTGIAGMVVYGYMVVSLLRLGLRAVAHKKLHFIGAVYVSSILAIIVHSLFINSLFYPWVMVWVWMGTGAVEQQIREYT